VIVRYADTSALVRAYLHDEPEHEALKDLLLGPGSTTVTSELTQIEFASALRAAERAGRVPVAEEVIEHFDADCGDAGPIALVELDRAVVVASARALVMRNAVRTLDALHLAVATAVQAAQTAEDEFVLVTRDDSQADVARTIGLVVA
jgi:predicted nucleic acid-binding protein